VKPAKRIFKVCHLRRKLVEDSDCTERWIEVHRP